jgi:endonuclease-3
MCLFLVKKDFGLARLYYIFYVLGMNVTRVLQLLSAEYGLPHWHSDGGPLSVLIRTVLSQNTSDTNSSRAFLSLIAAFPRWEDVADADVGEIAATIRPGGLANIKAMRIKQILEVIKQKCGNFSLDFLKDMPLDEARAWLKELPGVGEKTAACVLLFSLGRPALPVDTHVHRVAQRLGLIGAGVSAEQAHVALPQLVPSGCIYEFHMLFIEHGRRICKARNPKCPVCVLRAICPTYKRLRQNFSSSMQSGR